MLPSRSSHVQTTGLSVMTEIWSAMTWFEVDICPSKEVSQSSVLASAMTRRAHIIGV